MNPQKNKGDRAEREEGIATKIDTGSSWVVR